MNLSKSSSEFRDGAAEAEANAMRDRYARREDDYGETTRYHPCRPDRLVSRHEKEQIVSAYFRRKWFGRIGSLRVLEVGCESGKTLQMLIGLGINPANVVGIDLLEHHIVRAREGLPAAAQLQVADALKEAIEPESFDLVVQSTVFSSILNPDLRQQLAARMLKWVRRDGAMMWYDLYWNNPKNRDVRGIKRRELRSLFPNTRIVARRATLAPPLARALAPMGYAACRLATQIAPFRSHMFAWIEPL